MEKATQEERNHHRLVMLDRESLGLNSRDTHSPKCSRALPLDPQCVISFTYTRRDEIRPDLVWCLPCVSTRNMTTGNRAHHFATPSSPGLMSGPGHLLRMPAERHTNISFDRNQAFRVAVLASTEVRPGPGGFRTLGCQRRGGVVPIDSQTVCGITS